MTDSAYYCDKCKQSWKFHTARGMAEFGTHHLRDCTPDGLRDRIAAILDREIDGLWEPLEVADVLIQELGLPLNWGRPSFDNGTADD